MFERWKKGIWRSFLFLLILKDFNPKHTMYVAIFEVCEWTEFTFLCVIPVCSICIIQSKFYICLCAYVKFLLTKITTVILRLEIYCIGFVYTIFDYLLYNVEFRIIIDSFNWKFNQRNCTMWLTTSESENMQVKISSSDKQSKTGKLNFIICQLQDSL